VPFGHHEIALDHASPSGRARRKLDDLDLKIMNYLRQNGRLPGSHIARELGVPDATVRYRLKRLKSDGFVIAMLVPNLDRVARRLLIFFTVRTVPGKAMDLVHTLREQPEVRFLAMGSGHYDLFVSAAFHNEDDYLRFRHEVLGSSDAVEQFELLQLVKVFTRTYDPTLPGEATPFEVREH
jgi:Lrp/AsnC family transcriptional regulator for asnA, asnC and gidA